MNTASVDGKTVNGSRNHLFLNEVDRRESENSQTPTITTTTTTTTTIGSENQQKLLDRCVETPKVGTNEAKTRRRHWENSHMPSMHIKGSDKKVLSSAQASTGLNMYSPSQLPWLVEHHSYFKDEDGVLVTMKHGNYVGGNSMVMYAANANAMPQYTTKKILQTAKEPLRHVEAFATADKKGIDQGLRSTYPIYEYRACRGFKQDRGHGIDFILTQPETNHSSIASSNYTPQNAVYNRQVRRLLVEKIGEEDGASFKEINIYGQNPDQLIQSIKGEYTISKKPAAHSIDVPEGFLFIVYDASKKIKNVYYFPNFIDYAQVKKEENVNYKGVPAVFEIQIPKAMLFGKEFNLLGTNVYEPKKSEDDIFKEVRGKSFFGFRMLSGRYKVTYKGESEWIPAEAKQALERTLALKSLNEMAESEFTSVEYKLALIRTLLSKMIYAELGQSLYNPVSALLWIRRAQEQVANESSLKEKLELLDFYELLKHQHPEIYNNPGSDIKNKCASLFQWIIIQEHDEGSSIEEKIQISVRFKKLENKLKYIEKAERHIFSDLSSDNTDDMIIAIEELHNLADYYSQFLGKPYYDIPLNYKRAHELYQIFFMKYSSYFHNQDARLYHQHLGQMFEASPEAITYDQIITYAEFFRSRRFELFADLWDERAKFYDLSLQQN